MSDYDLVLLNGRVVDPESLFDAVSNVGIKGDRIMAITNEASKFVLTKDFHTGDARYSEDRAHACFPYYCIVLF